jgi:hypothetical protein
MKTNAIVLLNKTIEKIDGAYAPTTIRAYKADFTKFIEFCDSRDESALPALPITIAMYVAQLSTQAIGLLKCVAAIFNIPIDFINHCF